MNLAQAKVTTVVICAAVIVAMLAIAWWQMENMRQQILENNALTAARSYATTFESLRAFYTKEVVARVPKDSVTVSHNYKNISHAIPLPATLTIELAKEVGRRSDGFSVRLYSNYPYPWRGEPGQLKGFEKRAFEKLTATPAEPYYEVEQSQSGKYLRYATADIMQPDCVACHNSNPESRKKDWKVGDLRGVLEIGMPMRMPMDTIMETFDYLLVYFIIGGIIIIVTVLQVLRKRQ